MHITLRQLQYFLAVCQTGTTAQAAQTLHVSQPSISKAVTDLEALWGERLFIRHHAKGMELTAAGLARRQQVQDLLQAAQQLEQPRTDQPQGPFRLGFLSTLGPRWVPHIVQQLHTQFPRIELHLHEGSIDTLTEQVAQGVLDAALHYNTGLWLPQLRLHAIASLAPYALLPAQHPLCQQRSVSLVELAQHPLLLIDLPHSKQYFLSLFRDAGLHPQVAYAFSLLEMLRSMVAHGHGVALLTTRPLSTVTHDGQHVVYRRLKGRVVPQDVVLTTHRLHASALTPWVLQAIEKVFRSTQRSKTSQ